MEVISDTSVLGARLDRARHDSKRIALVPTMGNLHEGHLALVRQAHGLAEFVVVSVFVNPLQFDRAEDLSAYPRTMERDMDLLDREKVDLLFSPSADLIYPRGLKNTTYVEVPGLSDILCGADRPGHFRGVATVVTILLNLVRPDTAIFGEKDYQQLLIIQRLIQDLALGVEVASAKTVREADGLAMSSRNTYLTLEERQTAPVLNRVLCELAARIGTDGKTYEQLEAEGMKCLAEAGLRPDYVAIRRASDLMPPGAEDGELRLLAAASLGKARLIDNVSVSVRS